MRARRVMMAALAVVLLAAGGCTGGSGGRSGNSNGASSGAEGIGDPYFPGYGNGGYDVTSYGLKLRYDPATDKLTGQALITATATADLSRFNLDFIGYDIESLRIDDANAKYTRQGDELVVTLDRGLPNGRKFTVDVRYSGVPQPIGDPGLGAEGFLNTDDGAIALGEPQSASGWFPVNDHPRDKATYTIEVTVPDGLTALSNGVQEGTTKADGWTTWRWAEHDPMASYLATVVIGKYRVTTGTHDGRPIVTAVAESIPKGVADQALARTGEIADFLATQFGPYPFDAYGGIVHNNDSVGFALETQSRPVYAPGFFRAGGGDGTTVVAHELAHQWFGDSVSLHEWRDIWLNEGFATYAEWLWLEHVGQATVQESFDRTYQAAADSFWTVAPGDPGVPSLFSAAVYRRGGMTVHALRRAVGDNAFFRILKAWTSEKRNGNGTTSEFIALSERISGKPVRSLFEAWLYQKSKPAVP